MGHLSPEKRAKAREYARTDKAKAARAKYRKTEKYKEYRRKYCASEKHREIIYARRRLRYREDPEFREKLLKYAREYQKKRYRSRKLDSEEVEKNKELELKKTGHTRLTDADIDRYIEDILRPRQILKDDDPT